MTQSKRGSASGFERGRTREPEIPQQVTAQPVKNSTTKFSESKTPIADRRVSGKNGSQNDYLEGVRRSPRKSQGILGPAIAATMDTNNPVTPQKSKAGSSATRSNVKLPFSDYSSSVMDGNYAGPNFHHSPAPAVLPAPSFGHSKAVLKETNHDNVTAFDSFDSFMQAISASASGNTKPDVPLHTRPSTSARTLSSAISGGLYTNGNGSTSPFRPTSHSSSLPTLTPDTSPESKLYDVNGVSRAMS